MKTYLKLPAIVGVLGAAVLLAGPNVATPKASADKSAASQSYDQNSERNDPNSGRAHVKSS
jgi:hypothetical protein